MQHNKDGEQKLFNLFGRFSLVCIFGVSTLFGGSFEDFKQSQSQSFKHYKDSRDGAFNAYLKQQWREYNAYVTPPMFTKPKPKAIVPLVQKKPPYVGPIVQIRVPQTKKPHFIVLPKKRVKKDVNILFFGSKLGFDVDKRVFGKDFYPKNQSGIANFFSFLAATHYQELLREIKGYKRDMQLNDWAVNLLVKKIAQKIYAQSSEAKILQWFLLNKLGYDVKIGLTNSRVPILLYATKEVVYATPRYHFGLKNYYALAYYNKKGAMQVYTYDKKYPKATKSLEFALPQLPNLLYAPIDKEVKFRDYAKEYKFSYKLNKNLVDFMATYPQVDYRVYFNAPMEANTYKALALEIKNYADGKKITQGMDFVLHFVQKAFHYERDQEQFGHEKVMFSEETLAYPASDCEDRAILFATLMKKFFGVGVVGVKYSDHMTTALYIPIAGDSVKVGQRRYVIADPTYINANLGQSMPKYRSIMPESFIYVR